MSRSWAQHALVLNARLSTHSPGYLLMKLKITALAATMMAALLLALPSSPANAGPGPDYLCVGAPHPSGQPCGPQPSYEVGQELQIFLDINEGDNDAFPISLQDSDAPGGPYSDVAGQTGKTASSYGKYTFTYSPAGEKYLRVAWTQSGTHYSEILHLTPTAAVVQTGTLDAPSSDGKTWTAHFTPGQAGKAVQFQVQQIATWETDEVNPTNPEQTDTKLWQGPWKTIANGTQDASGDVTFNLSSPYPWRVKHKYRAVSGSAKTCDPPTTDTCQKFGIANPTGFDTGLSKVFFNTNEGHAVDTRTHYFEGEFSMTADTEGLGCTAVNSNTGDQTKKLNHSVLKGRGNYSWSFKRKSYTLKLGDSTDLCGMGNGAKSKKWALVSQDYDKSFLRNALAGYIGDKVMGSVWTPNSRPVDLYINGKYLGNYLLIERVAIAAQRININELNGDDPNEQVEPGITGGYVLEWDFRKGADYNAYLGSDSGYVGVKEPENDYSRVGSSTGPGTKTNKGISSAQKTYISNYLNAADSALRSGSCQSTSWTNYIDQASAVDYYIAMEYMKPVDGNMWASVFMYKPQGEKIHFGPLWDFDLAAGSANRAGNVVSPSSFYLRNNLGVSAQQSSNTWFNCLNKRSSFRAAVKARWNDVKDDINTTTFLNDQKDIIANSAAQSFSSSPSSHSYRISDYQIIKSSWSADVSYLVSWASSRKSWLSSNF